MLKILFLCCVLGLFSCTLPKEARQLKNATKQWRESPVVLDSWADSPFSGSFLTLRENGKFERYSDGIIRSFSAGNWTQSHDTIALTYTDIRQKTIKTQRVSVDMETSTLIFIGTPTPVLMRLKILTNRLGKF
jgi:hypothetical protein